MRKNLMMDYSVASYIVEDNKVTFLISEYDDKGMKQVSPLEFEKYIKNLAYVFVMSGEKMSNDYRSFVKDYTKLLLNTKLTF